MGDLATDDYMSSHSLSFSTPEMTLKKFALWLGEQVNDPKTNVSVPRLILYVEDRIESANSSQIANNKPDFLPDVDETFKPTGAISALFGGNAHDNLLLLPYGKKILYQLWYPC